MMGEQFVWDVMQIPYGPWPEDIKEQVIYVGFWIIMVVVLAVTFRDPAGPGLLKKLLKSFNSKKDNV